MMRRSVQTVLLVAWVSTGCGPSSPISKTGSPQTTPPASTQRQTPPSISRERRIESITDARNQFHASLGKPIAERSLGLTRWIAGRPEFEAAGSADSSSAWLRFSDGRILVLKDPDTPGGPGWRGGGRAPQAPVAPTTPVYFENGDLPASNRYAIVNSPSLQDTRYHLPPRVLQWLEASGYVNGGTGASVDDLKQLKDVGIFYIDTHGSVGEDVNGRLTFGMVTASLVANRADDDADFAAGRLIYFDMNGRTWYAITAKFVRDHITVSPGAFVFVNACHSADEEFITAFLDKGAGVYFGWTPSVGDPSAFRAATFLFDRLTGSNEFLAETPRQRPFNVGALYNQLVKEGYASAWVSSLPWDPTNPVTWTRSSVPLVPNPPAQRRLPSIDLQVRFGPKGTAILRPIIALMNVMEFEGTLEVRGMFGSTPGNVTIGGAPVTVKEWTREAIQVALPAAGAGSAGPVVVEVEGRKSIPVPITEWRGALRYTEEDRSNGAPLTKIATVVLHLRAVLQPYRVTPGEKPRLFEDVVSATEVLFTTSVTPATDSSIQWTFSGQARTANVLYTLTGSGTAPYQVPGAVPAFVSSARVDTRRRVMFDVWINSSIEGGTLTLTDTAGQTITEPAFLMLGIHDVAFAMDGLFNIQAGRHVQTDGPITRRLEWDAIPATYAPSPTGPF